jgi:hypothetical protein
MVNDRQWWTQERLCCSFIAIERSQKLDALVLSLSKSAFVRATCLVRLGSRACRSMNRRGGFPMTAKG